MPARLLKKIFRAAKKLSLYIPQKLLFWNNQEDRADTGRSKEEINKQNNTNIKNAKITIYIKKTVDVWKKNPKI